MKYVLAISGGIDSMALLDMVATDYHGFRQRNFPQAVWPDDFIVGHFDHGIRGEQSWRDAELVMRVCDQYGVKCKVGRGYLAAGTSEATARQARYDFLYNCLRQMGDDGKLVVAHHRDDLLETVVMNLIRGTGWRGLAPMESPDIIRPLLSYRKAELAKYTIEHNLSWAEDQTNYSPRYFRNRVRMTLSAVSEENKKALYQLVQRQLELRRQIEMDEQHYWQTVVCQVDDVITVRRYVVIMLPMVVALELLRHITGRQLTAPQLQQLYWFTKTAKIGKRMQWRTVSVSVTKTKLCVKRSYRAGQPDD